MDIRRGFVLVRHQVVSVGAAELVGAAGPLVEVHVVLAARVAVLFVAKA